MAKAKNIKNSKPGIFKSLTGIQGLDEVTNGGLPKGRSTLICGGPGSGKTLFALTFLAKGAIDYGEPGVLASFEETEEELTQNIVSLGFDLEKLAAQKKIAIEYFYIQRNEIQESGNFNLDGVFVRLEHAIDSVGAKRVVLDSIEALFSGFSNELILRSELRRLFRWLKAKGVTAVITAERGTANLTRYGLEEYLSDCVILLDNQVTSLIATRRLRIVKYRGTSHGSDEYPFLISEQGITVLPITSVGLDYEVSTKYLPTGIAGLDRALSDKGFYRGSSVLVSGTAGSGKTSFLTQVVATACERGEACIYFAFEESVKQIIRNVRSVGIDLDKYVKKGLLRFEAVRPSLHGLEMHLSRMHRVTEEVKPSLVIMDPMSNLTPVASLAEIKSMLTRLIDFFKMNGITVLFSNLTQGGANEELTDTGISSLVDTWIVLQTIEREGVRGRLLHIVKSRGMAHSMQVHEYELTSRGIKVKAGRKLTQAAGRSKA